MHILKRAILFAVPIAALIAAYVFFVKPEATSQKPQALLETQAHVLTGEAAFPAAQNEEPGVRRRVTLADLPEPSQIDWLDNEPPITSRRADVLPKAPPGFKVEVYAEGFTQSRLMRTAPNGDLFLADSEAGKVIVLRGQAPNGHAAEIETYAGGLDHPFGIAFYPLGANPEWVYVANTTSVVRFAYKPGDLKASGAPQTVVPVLPGAPHIKFGGHWTRDVAFSLDGKLMWVSVGSSSDSDDPDTHPVEKDRADVLEFTPEGKFVEVYASGIRNCVGEAVNPLTGQLWCSVNERNWIGANLVPDYITSIQESGFYGWPWWYMGGHQDPRHIGKHPELKAKVITPDVLLPAHFASLEMAFYPDDATVKSQAIAGAFPAAYRGDAFAAEHGSGNRQIRTGYEVVRIPMKDGHATGEFEDFLTGFVRDDDKVWGRPVGVAVGKDGSLFVSDDVGNTVWHVSYVGR